MSASNELRVFISSTFRDLQEEREHLIKRIFPEIRALCRQRGVTFTDIDLRWGITREEAEREGIVRICLEEVDRCRPYFIGILAERYGWTPPSSDTDRLAREFPDLTGALTDGASITEIEIAHGVLANPDMTDHAFFYFRDRAATPDEFVDSDSIAVERLRALKQRIRQSGFPLREDFTSPVELGQWIEADLQRVLDVEHPESQTPSSLELERRAHAAFAASRKRAYVPNPDHLRRFHEWIEAHRRNDDATPLIIGGASGLGKSSLTAHLVDDYRSSHPTAFVIEHYLGATANSGSATATIRHVVEEIRERFAITDELPTNPDELVKSFPNWLYRAEHEAAKLGAPMLIFIDAVNQLNDEGQRLAWLPKTVPSGIALALSTTPGESNARLEERGWDRLDVQPLMDRTVRAAIVRRYLGEFRKAITDRQVERLTADEKAASPLFLRVVAEELRIHGEHETLDDAIDRYVRAGELLDVFDIMLGRMEVDYGVKSVRELLCAVWASRSGLTESELLGITGIVRLDLSRLLLAFDYHFVQREGMLGFFHDYLRRAVERRYLSRASDKHSAHSSLITWFDALPAGERNSRELAWNLHAIGATDKLKMVLANIQHFMWLYSGETDWEVSSYWSELGEPAIVEDAYHDGLTQWRQNGSPDFEEIAVLARVGELLERKGRLREALRIQQERLSLARIGEDATEVAKTRLALGVLQMRLGENATALSELKQVADYFGETHRQAEMANAIGHMGTLYYALGDLDPALDCFSKCRTIAEEIGDRRQFSYAVGNMGVIYRARAENDRALDCFAQWESISRERGDRRGIAFAVGNMGGVWMDTGYFDKALDCFTQAETIGRLLGDGLILSIVLVNIAMVHNERGEQNDALRYYRDVEATARERGDRQGLLSALTGIGGIQTSLREYDRGLELLAEAETLARELGDRPEEAQILLRQGIAHKARGEYKRALERYERAEALARDIEHHRVLSMTLGRGGQLHHALGKYDEALNRFLSAIEECRGIGYEHGARSWLVGAAGLLLDVIRNVTEMPPFLVLVFPELSRSPEHSWRDDVTQRARQLVDDSIAIARARGDQPMLFEERILLARIDDANGNSARAIEQLRDMQREELDDFGRAEVLYRIWHLTQSNDDRTEALCCYRSLPQTKLNDENRTRVSELEANE